MSLPETRQLNFFFEADVDVAAAMPGRPMRRSRSDVNEVRERVLEELRPGVVAQWVDPFERLGVVRPRMLRAPPSPTKAGRVEARSIR